MFYRFNDELIDLVSVESGAAGNESGTGADSELSDVECGIRIAVGGGGSFVPGWGAGGKLAASHAVDLVV